MSLRELLARMPLPWPAAQPQPQGCRVDPPTEPLLPVRAGSDPGLPARTVDELLAPHADLLGRLKLSYGSDRATFETDLMKPVRAYAAYVGALPATPDNFFCEPGGLLRLGLEIGFVALQATDGHIVCGRSTISKRQHLEPRWRLATFLAGLCSELHRTLTHVVVTNEHGHEWPAYLHPLSQWLGDRQQRRFFVRWPAEVQEFPALGLYALAHVAAPAVMQHLAGGNHIVVPQLISTLVGSPLFREPNMMAEIVRRSAALVIDRDLIACTNRSGRPVLGAHMQRYLIDVMRRLVVSHPAWVPNGDRSRVWFGPEGLFVIWPNAATEMRRMLDDDETPGMPKTADDMLAVLTRAAVVEPCNAEQPLWSITPSPGGQPIQAIKLASPEILLPVHAQGPQALRTPLVGACAAAPSAGAGAPGPAPVPAAAGIGHRHKDQRNASPGAPGPQAQASPPPGAGGLMPSTPAPSRTSAQPQELVPGSASVPIPAPAPAGVPLQETQELSRSAQLSLPGMAPAVEAPAAPAVDAASPGAAVPAVEPPAVGGGASAEGSPPESRADARPELSLEAPIRLNRKVRDALSAAVESLNGDVHEAVAVTVPSGVFVPLSFLRSQRIEVPVVLRELAEAGMAVHCASGRAVAQQHELGGQMELGIVIKPSFVRGLASNDITGTQATGSA